MTSEEYDALLRSAFDKYLGARSSDAAPPTQDYLPYDFSFIANRKWHLLGEEMVECDLRELTNLINHWKGSLKRWYAWNLITSEYDEDTAWDLRREFVESIAHECLLRPSSVRDAITSVATNALHQARLSIEDSYRDLMEGDPLSPSDKPKHLSRRQKESRLEKIASVWPESQEFMSSIRALDNDDYRRETKDYRNLSSHTIGPRLAIGHTRTVTRIVSQAEELKEHANGRIEFVPVAGKMKVSYGFGGTPPLNLTDAHAANLDQFHLAVACYARYRQLLSVVASAIPSNSGRADA